MDYLTLKQLHVACALVSYAGFFARGIGVIADARWMKRRWVRIAPHVVDTVLLGSAIALAVMSRQYPVATDWLTAKVVGLVAYIALGLVALRFGRTRRIRLAAWIAAQAVFFYIIAVALTRSPAPWQ